MKALSLGERLFIQGGIAQDLRTDGRRKLDYRPLYMEIGAIPLANGSARVRFGGTDVIVSVKAEIGRPSLMQQDKGKVSIHVDCSTTAAPRVERGEELSSELSLALQQCLLGGKRGAVAGIDLSSPIIVEGKVCWDLYIDGLIVSSDGNLLDALGAVIKVGRHYIVDATAEEESQMSSAVSVSLNQKRLICGLTKRGGASLDPSVILDMISLAKMNDEV